MVRRLKIVVRLIVALAVTALLVVSSLLFITSVSTEPDEIDKLVFQNVFKLEKTEKAASYEGEILSIRKVQHIVMQLAPLGKPIPAYASREPADLVKQGSGLCYDRSRTYDKVFKWMGFETRHVFILYKKNPADFSGKGRSLLGSLCTPGHPSHAVTEVKTSRGWILVDSNSEWIAVDRQGQPVPTDEIWRSKGRFESVPEYMLNPYWAIRGMYSRKGQFYKPYLPFPEFNMPDLVHWLINE